jgi:hypothetical protein
MEAPRGSVTRPERVALRDCAGAVAKVASKSAQVKTIVRIKVSLLISKIPLAMDGATARGREKGVV